MKVSSEDFEEETMSANWEEHGGKKKLKLARVMLLQDIAKLRGSLVAGVTTLTSLMDKLQ